MKRIYLCVVITIAAAFGCTAAFAQNTQDIVPAQMVTTPTLSLPKEAYESGLGGMVRVKIAIDESGNVTSVEDVTGPGPVCRQVKRDDVTAMREAAREAAMQARFNPATRKGNAVASSMWLNFDFPGTDAKKDLAASNDIAAPTRDGIEYTVKPDLNYSTSAVSKDQINASTTSRSLRSGSEMPRLINGGVLNGKATELPKPPYPAAARAVRASGAVSIQVLIDENGDVFSARAVSGHPLLRSASAIAACESRFTPTLLAGIPVRVAGIITYNFVP